MLAGAAESARTAWAGARGHRRGDRAVSGFGVAGDSLGPSFSDADMAALGKLTKLTSLTLDAPKLSPTGLNELKKLPLRP